MKKMKESRNENFYKQKSIKKDIDYANNTNDVI